MIKLEKIQMLLGFSQWQINMLMIQDPNYVQEKKSTEMSSQTKQEGGNIAWP